MSSAWVGAYMALWAAVLLVIVVLIGLVKQMASLHERGANGASHYQHPGGLDPGSRLPDFSAVDDQGMPVRSSDFLGREAIFLFLSLSCPPCEHLMTEARAAGGELDELHLIAVLDDSTDSQAVSVLPGVMTIHQTDHAVSRAFETNTTPHGFAIDRNGILVASTVPNSLEELRRLARSIDPRENHPSREADSAVPVASKERV